VAELDVMRYGVLTARRGWASKGDVLNAWSVEKLKGWLAKKSRL
jgi:DNA polymerase (family 10)